LSALTKFLEKSLGTSDRALLRAAAFILLPAALVVTAAAIAARLSAEPASKRLFDNVHWTVAYGAAALLAWCGVRADVSDSRGPRSLFAWALSAYFVGQVLWDVQVATGWNPFPGPSDLCFILLGPLSGAGLVALFRRQGSPGQRLPMALDVATLSAAVLALTLGLYLPKQGATEPLPMSFMVAYPVALCWAACVGLIFALTLHLKAQRGWVMFLFALLANGVLWLQWNALTLDGALADGTLYNVLFSVVALVQGTGVLLWKTETSASLSWERLCEGTLRMLPLLSVVLSAASVVVAYTIPGVPPAVKGVALIGGLVVVLLASLRQAVQLGERDRLIQVSARADRAIRESEERYRVLMEQAADGIFVANDRGVYLEVNARGAEMLGMRPEEIIGLSISDIVLPDEVPRVGTDLVKLNDGSAVQGEWRFRRKDGSFFWGEVTAKRLSDGRLQGLVRDVSERKRAEAERRDLQAQLLQSQKMQAVGSLAAGIAHDFNNMLAAIRGNAELASKDLAQDHPAWIAVEEIRKAGNRAAQLVEQIVAFSKPRQLSSQLVRLPQIVDEVVRLLRSMLPAAVEIKTSYGAALPPVMADPTQIHQVFVNLCTNAWQAMEDGPGVVSIQLERVPESPPASLGLSPGEYVCITVHDDGSGMHAETRDRVFEPFFTTKGVGKGAGLGLAVVHNIIESHHGAIAVESQPGVGTSFRIYLPAAPEDAVAVSPPPVKRRERSGGWRVLYVDDDEALVYLVTRQLQRLGHDVKGFLSPLEVLPVIEKDPYSFDVLVTDYNMPKMSGVKLTQEVRRLRGDAPVILTSGSISDEMRAVAERSGVAYLIQKPDTGDELCEAIERIASGLS
jgi:PAS domain S-box-containing protein